jgi:hypothetical protein
MDPQVAVFSEMAPGFCHMPESEYSFLLLFARLFIFEVSSFWKTKRKDFKLLNGPCLLGVKHFH